jgi:hypothetical protein
MPRPVISYACLYAHAHADGEGVDVQKVYHLRNWDPIEGYEILQTRELALQFIRLS